MLMRQIHVVFQQFNHYANLPFHLFPMVQQLQKIHSKLCTNYRGWTSFIVSKNQTNTSGNNIKVTSTVVYTGGISPTLFVHLWESTPRHLYNPKSIFKSSHLFYFSMLCLKASWVHTGVWTEAATNASLLTKGLDALDSISGPEQKPEVTMNEQLPLMWRTPTTAECACAS